MNHTERDIAIYTQVAFKAAADRNPDLSTAEGKQAFEEDVMYLSGLLVDVIEVNAAKHASAAAAPQPAASRPAPADASDGGDWEVEAITTKDNPNGNGAIPEWMKRAAKKDGVRKVFDNRHKLGDNDKLPWFKVPKDAAIHAEKPYWPPKGR